MDNAYFQRGARSSNFRLIRRGFHLTTVIDRPHDRLKRWGVDPSGLPSWKKSGRDIVIIPPSEWYVRIFDAQFWLDETVVTLRNTTDRPIRVKSNKPERLEDYLSSAWAMVTFGSAAGVEAAMAGVPVFAGPICPCIPISAGTLEQIETPQYHDRAPWLASLAYATWSEDEIDRINLEDYDYTCV